MRQRTMKNKFSERLLIVLMLAVLPGNAVANNRCQDLFAQSSTKIPKIAKRGQKIFRIEDINWLKRKLSEDKKLMNSDFSKDHSPLFSSMLHETINLLLHDFYRVESELYEVPGAKKFLSVIIQDITFHRSLNQVTPKYFLQINYAISKFISLKNNNGDGVASLRDTLQSISEANKGADYVTTRMQEHLEAIKNSPRLNETFVLLSNAGILMVPTFAELKVTDFLELGTGIAPIGMTLRTQSTFNGRAIANANSLFLHDLNHATLIYLGIKVMNARQMYYFSKIDSFFRVEENYSHLNRQEEILVKNYIFQKIHEEGKPRSFTEEFLEKEFFEQEYIYTPNSSRPEATIARMYDRLLEDNSKSELKRDMTFEEIIKILKPALVKTVKRFHEQDRL